MSANASTALARAAGELVGVPFRLHGRDPATGLDCVGLIAEALRRCGRTPVTPIGYRLRALDARPLLRFAGANGLARTQDRIASGDVLLVHIGGVQPHLLVATDRGGFVHAHAGLGRVVRQQGPLPWRCIGRWRLTDES